MISIAAAPSTLRSVAPSMSDRLDRSTVRAKALRGADLELCGSHRGADLSRVAAMQPPELLDAAIAARGWSVREASRRLGWDAKTVRRWLRGDCRVDGEAAAWALRVVLGEGAP